MQLNSPSCRKPINNRSGLIVADMAQHITSALFIYLFSFINYSDTSVHLSHIQEPSTGMRLAAGPNRARTSRLELNVHI